MILQRYPELTRHGIAAESYHWGRVAASENATQKANQGLITMAATYGTLYANLSDCGSEYMPAAGQSWVCFGNNARKEFAFVRGLVLPFVHYG